MAESHCRLKHRNTCLYRWLRKDRQPYHQTVNLFGAKFCRRFTYPLFTYSLFAMTLKVHSKVMTRNQTWNVMHVFAYTSRQAPTRRDNSERTLYIPNLFTWLLPSSRYFRRLGCLSLPVRPLLSLAMLRVNNY